MDHVRFGFGAGCEAAAKAEAAPKVGEVGLSPSELGSLF